MIGERVTYQAIVPMKQGFDSGCVPTSIAMVLSGFGIITSEGELVERYFPQINPSLPSERFGISMAGVATGVLQILDDLGLQDDLQLDVINPYLAEFTNSPEEQWFVRCNPLKVQRSASQFHDITAKELLVLAELAQRQEIGLYSVNNRMMQRYRTRGEYDVSNITRYLFPELDGFIRRGHVIGCCGGMMAHACAIDGIKIGEEGFLILDPDTTTSGFSYDGVFEASALFEIHDRRGVTQGGFDYLYRISQKEHP